MRIAGTSSTQTIVNQLNALKQQQTTLGSQLSSGLRVTKSSDDPSAMAQALNLSDQNAINSQYSRNITTLQTKATTVSGALSNIKDVVTRAEEIATQADGTTNTQDLQTYAVEVEGLIQQALSLANSKNGSQYIFGGTITDTPPYTTTTDADGNVTGVAYQGNVNTSQSEISGGTTVSADHVGDNTSGSGTRGVFCDTRYGADLFNHLITLVNDLRSGNTTAITTSDNAALAQDENNVIYQISSNNVTQTRLDSAATTANTLSDNINTDLTNTVGANTVSVATALSAAQTTYQAALESSTVLLQLNKNLLDYIGSSA